MKKRTILLIILVMILAAALAITLLIYRNKQKRVEEGHNLYQKTQVLMSNLPEMPEHYNYITLYFNDGETEWLYWQNGEHLLTAQRALGGQAAYFLNGSAWKWDGQGNFIKAEGSKSCVTEVLSDHIWALLADPDIHYSYHKAQGWDLPLWVYPGENYLQITRGDSYEKCEIIVLQEEINEVYPGSCPNFIRWNIASSPEDVTLYLHACTCDVHSNEGIYIRGWGTLDGEILNALFP